MRTFVALFLLTLPLAGQSRKLLVVSIDGLDHRYLQDRDQLKLHIPNLRKLIASGNLSGGLTGVVPTNTWPSHTTLVTGLRSAEHGILDNNIRTATGSERYWYMHYLKAPTLWQAAKKAGRTTSTITWPVTVGDGIDWNLPEYFQGRAGGAMDLKSIEEKATLGLVAAISKEYPSFAAQWMDDRTRALGTIYILKHHAPDLTLLHFVDHDSVAHEMGPFSREAIAALEYTDELLGQILAHLPANTVVAIVSDHGFEATPRELNLAAFLQRQKLPAAGTENRGGFVTTTDPNVAEALSRAGADPASCIGREIPRTEIDRFLPGTPAGTRMFEPAAGCFFGRGKADTALMTRREGGGHGHWPTRYKAAYLVSGPGIPRGTSPAMDMRDIAAKWAAILGIGWPPK
jgi:hypothetical protein